MKLNLNSFKSWNYVGSILLLLGNPFFFEMIIKANGSFIYNILLYKIKASW